jgi:hypothetical protein
MAPSVHDPPAYMRPAPNKDPHQTDLPSHLGPDPAVEQIPPCHNGPAPDLWNFGSRHSTDSRGSIMIQSTPVSVLRFKNQSNIAERELSAFFEAVETLFGREQALLSAEDWLDGIEQVLGPNQPWSRDWRAVTIAASSRLAHRLAVAPGKASDAHHNSFNRSVKPQVATDSARSKRNSAVWDSSNIVSSSG